MKNILFSIGLAIALVIGSFATPNTAQARPWGYRGGYYGGYGYRPYYGGYAYRPSYAGGYYSYRPYYSYPRYYSRPYYYGYPGVYASPSYGYYNYGYPGYYNYGYAPGFRAGTYVY